jgi:hypothetical protein
MTNYAEEIKLNPLGSAKKDKLFYELVKIMDMSYIDSIDTKEGLYQYIADEFKFTYEVLKAKDIEPDTTDHKDNEEELCLCGTSIKYHYIIKNNDTQLKCWVGSDCINNFFGQDIKDEVKKYHAEEKWGSSICLWCENELTNRKLKCQREHNCCDETCYELYLSDPKRYKMEYGKHIGKIYNDVINTKDGRAYLKWIYDNNKLTKYDKLWWNLRKSFAP